MPNALYYGDNLAVRLGAWWTVLSVGFACCFGALNVPRLYRVAAHPVLAEADVLTTDCANHGIVFYSYTAANEDYIGHSYLGQGCSQLGPGDRIRIYLSEADPTLSEAGNPRAALIKELITIALPAIFAASFVLILAYLWYWRPSHRRDANAVVNVIKRRNRLLAAVAAGVLVQPLVQFLKDEWRVLAAPGDLTIVAIWGPHGPVPDDRVAFGIACGVNIIFYSLIASVVIRLITHFRIKLLT